MAKTMTPADAPVVRVNAKNWHDVLQAAWMFPVLKAMRETTILAVTDEEIGSGAEQARQVFGTRVVRLSASALRAQYERTGDFEAASMAENWKRGARRVSDVSSDVLLDCARLCVAIKREMAARNAQTVAVDCNSIRSLDAGLPMPCMSHFQLNNEGATAVCTANVDVACAQTLLQKISQRPGIMAHATSHSPGRGVTLSHTACTNKVFGPQGEQNGYQLTRGDADKRTVYVRSLLPKGEPMTMVDLDLAGRRLRVAGAESAGAPERVDRCHTCIFARTRSDLAAAGSPPNRPCLFQFGTYAKRAAFAARLARVQPAGITDVTV